MRKIFDAITNSVGEEKMLKITKILAIICLIASVFMAILPCFSIDSKKLAKLIGKYDTGDAFGVSSMDSIDVEDYFEDLIIDAAGDAMSTGLISNMARSAVVLLTSLVVYSYSGNHYIQLLYYLMFLVGVPVITLISAGFQIWGKTEKKRLMCVVFAAISLVFCLSIFVTIPGTLISMIKDIMGAESIGVLSSAVRSLAFNVMIRCMSIGYWGFVALQVIALICTLYRYMYEGEGVVVAATRSAVEAVGKIIGVTGMYAGAEVPLDNGGIILGRDAEESQLIIDSPKVSRRHCRIYFDKDKGNYIVTDYSSNGTFVGTRRLTKGVAEILPSGSIIDIGDAKNSFRLQ